MRPRRFARTTCRECGGPLTEWEARTCAACKAATEVRRRACRKAAQIADAVRVAVIARDGRVCHYCGCAVVEGADGRYPTRDRLELDHVVPAVRGGRGTADNLVVCCMGCNRKKNTREVAA